MDYKAKGIQCAKEHVLAELMQWFQDAGSNLDTYCEKYGKTEFSYAKVIEKGHIYEMGYPRCLCPEALSGGKDVSFCECSRQSMIYVLENMMPEEHIEVELIETVLGGAKKCCFRVTVG